MALLRTALPVVAVVLLVACLGAVLASAGSTLGYDYQAYVQAARRLLDGRPLYDPAVDLAGGFAVYLYPPPFALAFTPLALLPDAVGTWLWTGMLVAALLAAIALLPVRAEVRWVVLLLAAVDWPVLYGIKLGQVGPILLLLFAVGWRWLDRDVVVGTAAGVGALIKVQPGLLLVWSLLTGRFRAAAAGLAVMAVGAAAGTLVTGLGAWGDYLSILGRVSAPVTTPHNFTPGAIAFQLGAGESAAAAVQIAALAATVAVVLAAIRWASAEASYLVTVVATQLASPLLWDHYAIVLLLPVAWLLQRGHWWAVAVPLVTSLPLVGRSPAVVYPIVFGVSLLAPLVVDRLAARQAPRSPAALRWSGNG